jgi:hypothetical protein
LCLQPQPRVDCTGKIALSLLHLTPALLLIGGHYAL